MNIFKLQMFSVSCLRLIVQLMWKQLGMTGGQNRATLNLNSAYTLLN